ncbi:hypothetical protein H0I76_13850 [Limibaculum sp. M0105]|uniref:Glycerophosphotransferase n=1 Tax=Thermohalobaculum xanthum TaxID=2753746 RepID=A0A8J7M9N2_9RHOB|nr:hypothetical protein [Thermohalobaculum xanthum]MBK0400278.1 hypothetical protein [Thermohalobaculum xanthum]
MQIGILLNHYEPHQVPHVVPYGFALSRLKPDWSVRILCSTRAEAEFAAEIGARYPGHSARIERIGAPLWAEAIDPVARHVAFTRKLAVQKANRALFATFDALIVPELTSLGLRDDPRLSAVKLIFTGHGAGDGYNNNVGMFDPRIDRFDMVLLQGRRIAAELTGLGRFENTPYAIAGYPKFEIGDMDDKRPRLFTNDRPVVLYNPTQTPAATSWRKFGIEILDFFDKSEDYNLIFAPHVLLFKRALSRGARLPRRYRSGPHMRIDLGSRASVDLSYLMAADIYLGDLSSQIYEFINWPRPCVFLNAHDFDWQENPAFRSWRFGPVIDRAHDLGAALAGARERFDAEFRPVQEAARDDAFLRGPEPASARGARAIATFMETGELGPEWH